MISGLFALALTANLAGASLSGEAIHPLVNTGPHPTALQAALPRARTLVQDFTTGTYSVATSANATGAATALDTGVHATKVYWTSATTGQYTGVKVSGPWDLSAGTLFSLDVGWDSASTQTRIGIFFCFDSGTTFTNYASLTTFSGGKQKGRRFALPILKSALAVSGVANWAAVQRVEIRLYKDTAVAATAIPMYVYGLWSNVTARPKVIIDFDDGHASQYTAAYPIMAAAGMRGTLFLNGNSVDTANHMTLAQIREMYAAGWDVGNHTYDHTILTQRGGITRSVGTATFTCSATTDAHGLLADGRTVTIEGADQPEYNGTFTVASVANAYTFTYAVSGTPVTPATGEIAFRKTADATIQSIVSQQATWLANNGLTRGAEHFAFPQGYFDDNSISLLQGLGMVSARTTTDGPVNYLRPSVSGVRDPYRIPALNFAFGTLGATAAQVLVYVDDAIAKNASIRLFGHKVVDSPATALEFSTTEFQALIDGLKSRRDAGQIDVVTAAEWFHRPAR